MACMTLFAQPLAMATTRLAGVVHYQDASSWHLEGNAEHNSLRMSWVVVTDKYGNRQLRMQWMPSAGDR